jgi:hypothetical protein
MIEKTQPLKDEAGVRIFCRNDGILMVKLSHGFCELGLATGGVAHASWHTHGGTQPMMLSGHQAIAL